MFAVLLLSACGGAVTELPCDGDARNCDDVVETAVSAGGSGTSLSARQFESDLVRQASACPPGQAEACILRTEIRTRRPGTQGRPPDSVSMETVRLRMRSNQLNAEIARLPPRDRRERVRLEREQRRIDNRVRTLETPWLRVPPPGVSF